MGIGISGAHFRGDPDGLHQLLFRGAMLKRGLGMAPGAIGALGDMRDRDRNDLFHLCRQSAICEDFLAERLESCLGIGASSRRFCASSRVDDGYRLRTSDTFKFSAFEGLGKFPPLATTCSHETGALRM